MKRAFLILSIVLLTAGCGSKEQKSEDQRGSATSGVSADIIGSDMGYIVEDATFADADAEAAFSIKGTMQLAPGPGSVLIIRSTSENGGTTQLLALAFPGFAEGTRIEYAPGDANGGYWIFGVSGETEVMKRTGRIAGSLRLVKKENAGNALGLNRDVQNGVGEIEVVVTGIESGGLPVEAEKKYAARFRLPIITLDELSRINQPI